MGLGLLSPLALFGLLSLLLPLLLHLQRRVQRTPLSFAALRWLRPLQRPRRHWRLRRPWLLLLRLLLAASLVLLLAEPVWRSEKAGPGWVLVHPALHPAALALNDPAGVERRWWAAGFPALAEPAPAIDQPFASLLRELDAGLATGTSLQVWSPPALDGMDGGLLRLQREVDWQVERRAQGTGPRAQESRAQQSRAQQSRAQQSRAQQSSAQGTGPSTQGNADDSARWLILRDSSALSPESVEGTRWLIAAAQALAAPDPDATAVFEAGVASTPIELLQAQIGTDLAPDAMTNIQALLWLEDTDWPGPVEAWLQGGGQLLWPKPCADCSASAGWFMLWRSAEGSGTMVARRQGHGRLIRPDQPLTPEHYPELLDGSFPHLLRNWLVERQSAPARAPAAAMQPLVGAPAGPVAARKLESWLLPLLALLILAERTLALWPPSRSQQPNGPQPS